MKTGTREGARKLKLQRHPLLLRPIVTLSRIGSRELSALSRVCTTLIPPSLRLPHRSSSHDGCRETSTKAAKVGKCDAKKRLLGKWDVCWHWALPILIRLDASRLLPQKKWVFFPACASLKWLYVFACK